MAEALAPAKVNLFLHVGAPAADGYHPVCSLMAFADFGDVVSARPGEGSLSVRGPFARGLGAEQDTWLVAVNGEPVERDHVLAPDDVVDCFEPVAGG